MEADLLYNQQEATRALCLYPVFSLTAAKANLLMAASDFFSFFKTRGGGFDLVYIPSIWVKSDKDNICRSEIDKL